MGIQLGGMVSGMDTQSIINQLMQAERQPIAQKQTEIATLRESKQLWEDLNSKITAFQSLTTDLKLSSSFNGKSVSTSDDTKANATATNNASNTSYVLENIILATPGKITSGTPMSMVNGVKANSETASAIADGNKRFNDGTTVVSGNFKINGKTINVAANDTINLVISKINGAGTGVTASFDSATGKFKLEATEAGSAKKIEIDSSDTSGFMTAMGLGGSLGTKISNGINPDQGRVIQDVAGLSSIQTGFFTVNGYTFEVDKTKDTLSGVLSKINSSNAGVTAFYDQDTKSVSFTSKDTGKDLTLENDTSGFLSAINVMNQANDTNAAGDKSVYKGTDAKVTMNGVEFTKTSNKFSMNGINFELKSSTNTGEKVTINVKNDVDKTYNKIKAFVDKYNEIADYIETNTKISTDANGKSSKASALQGDSMADNLHYNLRQKLTSIVSGVATGFNQLASIGLEAKDSKSSKLTMDATKLKAALDSNPDEVKKLFIQSAAGTVSGESVGTGNGTTTAYKLEKIPSSLTNMEIKVGTTTYSGTNLITSGTPTAGQVLVNLATGNLQFGTAPPSGNEVLANYTYDSGKANEDGIAIRMEKYLKPYTIYNGGLQSHIKSFQTQIDSANKWITETDARLTLREDSLKRQFAAMEQAMQNSNSQGQWLSSQLSSLS